MQQIHNRIFVKFYVYCLLFNVYCLVTSCHEDERLAPEIPIPVITPTDSTNTSADSINVPGDSIPNVPGDSIPDVPGDSIVVPGDSIVVPGDTVPVTPPDTVPVIPPDTVPVIPPDTVPVVPPVDNKKPYITREVVWSSYPTLKNLNFVYPSKDPFGKTVMLSGTITMSRTMTADTRARGIILYNHYTVCRANQCPTEGMLDLPSVLSLAALGRHFITVSADYYGFGQTVDAMQAYCIATANARASVDALLAARQLLAERGYTWDDDLLNIGYSQGAQTAIAVLKLIGEEHPDIRFTRTMAGGGPYDLEETYRQYLAEGEVELPSAVISIVLAYNEYFRLGIPRSSLFIEPTLSHIDEWVLSKQYTSTQIDNKVGSHDIHTFIAPQLTDLQSDVARRMMKALARENLCQGWKPRTDENIMLLHHDSDEIAPSVNTQHLYDFFQSQGMHNVEMHTGNFLSLGVSQHVSGAAAFIAVVSKWIRENY